MILMGSAADDSVVRALNRDSYPLVLLEKSVKRMRLNTVCTDRVAGAGIMTAHLMSLGLRNLLIISGEDTASYDKEMLEELKAQRRNLKGSIRCILQLEVFPRQGRSLISAQIENFLRPPHRSDAIIVINSPLVFPLYLCAAGKKHPHPAGCCTGVDGRRHRVRPADNPGDQTAQTSVCHVAEGGQHSLV